MSGTCVADGGKWIPRERGGMAMEREGRGMRTAVVGAHGPDGRTPLSIRQHRLSRIVLICPEACGTPQGPRWASSTALKCLRGHGPAEQDVIECADVGPRASKCVPRRHSPPTRRAPGQARAPAMRARRHTAPTRRIPPPSAGRSCAVTWSRRCWRIGEQCPTAALARAAATEGSGVGSGSRGDNVDGV